jgi:prepilin-type N-terminal cleavage/methylation domain-containing protein
MKTSRLAQLRNRLAAQDGMSLMELIVAIMVTSIVLAIVGSMFVNVAKITSNSSATTTRTGTAANVMNEISTVIRPAVNNPVAGNDDADPAIVSGTALALTIYSFVDASPAAPAPTKVAFRIDAQGNVVEDRWTAVASGAFWVFTGTVFTRTLGGPVQSPAGTDPLFVYLDDLGAVLTPGTSGLTLAQREAVASVRVTVNIANQPTTGSDPIVVVNTFGMPNLKASRVDN